VGGRGGGGSRSTEPVDPSREQIPADPDYFYHATSNYNAADIQDDGKLVTHAPDYGTDQYSWPDGSRERRSYWTASPQTAGNFYPDNGRPVLLRASRSSVGFRRESTGDVYTNKAVPASKLEVYAGHGRWTPLSKW
jgi:hypothetical protein